MRAFVATALIALSSLSLAASLPYDEAADAKAEIQATLVDAKKANVPVLVVFGANWCGDCKLLDAAFKGETNAPLIEKNFKVVKVNVGRFDHNVEIAEAYGVPLKKGIPAVAVLASDGKVTYATREGELANARKLGEHGIYDFFVKVADAGK